MEKGPSELVVLGKLAGLIPDGIASAEVLFKLVHDAASALTVLKSASAELALANKQRGTLSDSGI